MWRRKRYKKSPSFLSIHVGVRAEALPVGTQCHHIIVEDWARMEEPFGTLFVSIPTLLDPSLSPDGTHIVHVFSPDWIDNWKVREAIPWFHVCNAMPLKGLACQQGACFWTPISRPSSGPCKSLRRLCLFTKSSNSIARRCHCYLTSAGAQCGRV